MSVTPLRLVVFLALDGLALRPRLGGGGNIGRRRGREMVTDSGFGQFSLKAIAGGWTGAEPSIGLFSE